MTAGPARATLRRMAELILYDFPTSPFCAKVRAVLHYQGAAFRAVDATRPGHWMALRRGTGKVPALAINGRLVFDSTDIAHELDALHPQRPVLPGDPQDRALCHLLEDWCDEALYFPALHRIWLDPAHDAIVRRRFPPGPLGALAWRAYRARVRRQLVGQGTARKPLEAIRRDLARDLQALADRLDGRRFLLGEQVWLCDFALFGQLRFLDFSADGRDLLARHPRLAAYAQDIRQLARARTADAD